MGKRTTKENKMRVTISGSQSVGKTTLINALKGEQFIRENNFQFCGNTTRNALHQGKKINEYGTNETQLLILSQHINNFVTDQNTIYDRCALDGLVYTYYLYTTAGTVSARVQDLSYSIFNTLQYDIMFYIPPETHVPLKEDGERSTSIKWQSEIHKIFKYMINRYRVPIIELTGSLDDRANKFIKIIKENYDNNIESLER